MKTVTLQPYGRPSWEETVVANFHGAEDLAIVLLNGFRSFPTYYTSQIVRPLFYPVARAGLEHAYSEALAQAYDAWRLSP